MALSSVHLDRQFVPLSSDLLHRADEPVDVEKVADVLQASLDGVLTGGDPRVAIRVAYGTLLDGLAHIGLSRRPEEGPDEHMERCLRAAELPGRSDPRAAAAVRPRPLQLASDHREHRARAVAALDAAIASVRRLEVVRMRAWIITVAACSP